MKDNKNIFKGQDEFTKRRRRKRRKKAREVYLG